ncbi:MAG: type II toxin-antitoxin system VapC family toxin [Gammaproteobacteria bacterium]|nr:type II toxin-antitoxin system VapC family toxin [Gammaproteobacteria bacterium]
MYILDTNVVSELRKVSLGKADPRVTEWQNSVELFGCFLSVITLMELEIGILAMERRDASQGNRLRAWFEHGVLQEFDGRILPEDQAVARRCAALHVPDPASERDALIAATALAHNMTVVTRNVKDFTGFGVPLLNPWHPARVHERRASYATRNAQAEANMVPGAGTSAT